ncbi:MAG: hypothetical protein U0R50_10835 [Gaiellales bacterium]
MATESLPLTAGLARPERILLGVARALAGRLALDVAALRLCLLGGALVAPPIAVAYLAAAPFVPHLRARGRARRFEGVEAQGLLGTAGLVCVELAAITLLRTAGWTIPDPLLLTVLAIQVPVTLAWRLILASDRGAWLQDLGRGRVLTIARVRVPVAALRVAAGLGLVLGAIELFTRSSVDVIGLRSSAEILLPIGLLTAGGAVVLLPPLLHLGGSLAAERRGRIRADERAKLAAHLHDSVLQTLTLIQRHAAEPTETAALARRQERELREWLYGNVTGEDSGRLRDRLAGLAAEIEDRYRWRVELVVVGDAEVDERVEQLLGAVREAMVNAARHSGAAACDVYAECGPDAISVFVRDRGRGFDPASVATDRRGIAESIVGRMRQAAGTATVRSSAEKGTDVGFELPWRATP